MKDIHTSNYINNDYYKNMFSTYMITYLSSMGYIQQPNDNFYLDHVGVSLKIVDEVKRFYEEER
jgi:hypothetical protein